MARPFRLYWKNIAMYEACPQQFLWSRGWGEIDLGNGPGRRKPLPLDERRSEHHIVMGEVIQKVLEDFYNLQLWQSYKPEELPAMLLERTREVFNAKMDKAWIQYGDRPYQSPPRDELLKVCEEGVLGYLKTMKHHRLLGVRNRSEASLVGLLNGEIPVGGKVDFIIERNRDSSVNPGITILDGKNSKDPGKYTDENQVRWYALCLLIAEGVLPDRIGFVTYRYPYGTPKEDGGVHTGIHWLEFTPDDMKSLATRAVDVYGGMCREEFEARPVPKVCKFCDYEFCCPERQAQLEASRKKRGLPSREGEGDLKDLIRKGGITEMT